MTESETILIESNSNIESIEDLGGEMNLSWENTFDQQTAVTLQIFDFRYIFDKAQVL